MQVARGDRRPSAYVLPRETALQVVALGGDNHSTRPAVNLRKAHHVLGPYLLRLEIA